jgi:hypothetical protein
VRRLALVITAASLLIAACSAPPVATVLPTAAPAARPEPPRCAWYTPEIGPALGQIVTVAITGPACLDTTLIHWIAVKTGRPWAQTTIAPGTLIAQLTRGETTVRIWQYGSAVPTDETAGYLADDFLTAGWKPERATCAPQPFCGPPITPPESPDPG